MKHKHCIYATHILYTPYIQFISPQVFHLLHPISPRDNNYTILREISILLQLHSHGKPWRHWIPNYLELNQSSLELHPCATPHTATQSCIGYLNPCFTCWIWLKWSIHYSQEHLRWTNLVHSEKKKFLSYDSLINSCKCMYNVSCNWSASNHTL